MTDRHFQYSSIAIQPHLHINYYILTERACQSVIMLSDISVIRLIKCKLRCMHAYIYFG